nr:hypothetical protein [Simkaniaceae bacterium]
YDNALKTYQLVSDPAIVEKTLLNKLQCYYELDRYKELAKDGFPYLASKTTEMQERKAELHFLMGEALFRQALASENAAEKITFARKARDSYENLPEGQYKEISEFAVAEIHGILGDYEKGATAYQKLAEKHSHMKEDLLFQVASLQARYNKKAATETFRKVKAMKGKKASEATFNFIVLLFQNEAYEEVINSYGALLENIPEDALPTFNFIVGKSYFCAGQYQNAISPLKKYIDSTYVPSDQLKNALLIQMTCAHQISDAALFSQAFNRLDALFPNDPEMAKALFMHAMILKEQGAFSKAAEKLKMIKDNYAGFDNQENFLFEYGLLAHQNERWLEAYESFQTYVTDFKDSDRIHAAWKLLLSSSLNLYKHCSEENNDSKLNFFNDLQAVLTRSDCLNDDEMKDYSLLYAKTAYELDHHSEALRCLQDHIFTKSSIEKDPISLAEAHFMAGLCYAETEADNAALCMHLEKAIALNPDFYDSSSTHLQLYNAYISLAGYGEIEKIPPDAAQQKEWIHHAAKHLQEAVSKEDVTIKKENRLWLADHYYQKVQDYYDGKQQRETNPPPEVTNATDRASSHYQALLLSDTKLLPITPENLHLEHEVVKLAKLLSYQKAHEKKLDLLKQLLEQQTDKFALNWGSQKEAFFELAIAYDALGEKEKAFETYRFIQASAAPFPTALANHAQLRATRLQFELLEEELKNETNEEVLSILNDLKELQIRKNASSEPTHLEAALDYAKIRSLLSERSEQDRRYLFFLNRIKDDFTSQEDLVTQDYLANLQRDSSKKQIFDAYMKFINAEKIRLEAKNLYQQERLGEMEKLHENALTLYSEIKAHSHIPPDLYERVSVSVQEMNAVNAY